MHEIRIFLGNAASLATIAAPVPPAGAAALPAGMVANPRIYLIVNTTTNTRYAGITTNLQNRFNARMAVVNELGLSAANMAGIWAWWGGVSVRRFPPPAHFPAAFPASVAGLPANLYALPGGPATVCPAAVPNVIPGAPSPMTTAQNAAAFPFHLAYGAFQAWTASPLPRTAATIHANWPAAAVAPSPSPVIRGTIAAQPSALMAARVAATSLGAPLANAIVAAAAIQAYSAGLVPAPSSEAAVVSTYFGGPALPAPPAPTVLINRNPIGGGGAVTTLTHVLAGGGGAVDLEHVFIRFVLQHLVGGVVPAFITNGAKTGPLAWPGGVLPICVTWNSAAGAGFPAFARSVIWWPGTAF